MQLHLVVPGLLWPSSLLRDNSRDLELPALANLLGRGRLDWQPPLSPEAALCQAFELGLAQASDSAAPSPPLPLAALRYLGSLENAGNVENPGSGGTPAKDYWLCADPVHLSLQRTRLMLDRNVPPASDSELQLIAQSINGLLQQQDVDFLRHARFIAGHQGQGYLLLPASAPPGTHAAWQALQTTSPVMAASHDDLLPQGTSATALRWRQFANEAQMHLHQLSINQAREARGVAPLNALWLWGNGCLPAPSMDAASRPSDIMGLCTQDDNRYLLAGLAQLHGQTLTNVSSVAQLLPLKHDSLWLTDCLQASWQEWDVLGWRQQILALEQGWLQPLWSAWQQQHLTALTLTAPGRNATLQLRLRPLDRLRFWRKPCPLAALSFPAENATD